MSDEIAAIEARWDSMYGSRGRSARMSCKAIRTMYADVKTLLAALAKCEAEVDGLAQELGYQYRFVEIANQERDAARAEVEALTVERKALMEELREVAR